MTLIPSLQLETWFIGVLSGSAEIYLGVALFAIIGLAAFFRMTTLTLGFMVFVFVLMFSGFIPSSIFTLIAIIGGVVLGRIISRIVKN